jgi:hypothetical protein
MRFGHADEAASGLGGGLKLVLHLVPRCSLLCLHLTRPMVGSPQWGSLDFG